MRLALQNFLVCDVASDQGLARDPKIGGVFGGAVLEPFFDP
jgi:hypothetical protein